MSLLDQGTHTVVIFPDTETVDGDGNPTMRPSGNGFHATATVQPISSTEAAEMGVQTGEVYRLRFAKPEPALGPGAQVEWMCSRWSVVGFPEIHSGSRRTSHLTYKIKRS